MSNSYYMKDMMITFHVDGTKQPIVLPVGKASDFAKELEGAGKKWRLGRTC